MTRRHRNPHITCAGDLAESRAWRTDMVCSRFFAGWIRRCNTPFISAIVGYIICDPEAGTMSKRGFPIELMFPVSRHQAMRAAIVNCICPDCGSCLGIRSNQFLCRRCGRDWRSAWDLIQKWGGTVRGRVRNRKAATRVRQHRIAKPEKQPVLQVHGSELPFGPNLKENAVVLGSPDPLPASTQASSGTIST